MDREAAIMELWGSARALFFGEGTAKKKRADMILHSFERKEKFAIGKNNACIL